MGTYTLAANKSKTIKEKVSAGDKWSIKIIDGSGHLRVSIGNDEDGPLITYGAFMEKGDTIIDMAALEEPLGSAQKVSGTVELTAMNDMKVEVSLDRGETK